MPSVLEAIVNGTTYDLSDMLDYGILKLGGFGLAPLHRLNERGPMQHGTSDRGFRLDPRVMQLALVAMGDDYDDYWAKREELLDIFAPDDDPIILRHTDSRGTVKQIDCHVTGGMEMNSENARGTALEVAVELTADDPSWYNPEWQALTFGISAGGHSMVVPLVVPWKVGSSIVNMTKTIVYTGSWESFPYITITGPITDCVITHVATGNKLDFTGTTIAAGQQYVIDCRYGYKTVTKVSDSSNKISELIDSDLSVFRLLTRRSSLAPGGANDISVTGTAATSATEIYFQYRLHSAGI
jgi:hypothetical protein